MKFEKRVLPHFFVRLGFWGLISVMPLVSAELTAVESRLAEIAKQQKAPAIALLEQVVNINSGTMNHAGVKQVADVFDQEFKALGFETRWHDMSEVDRAGHLFADNGGPGVCQLLIGHLDTVFEAISTESQNYRTTGERLYPRYWGFDVTRRFGG